MSALLANPWFVAPVVVILLLLLVALARVLNIGHDAGGHRGEPGAKPDKTPPPKAAPGEDAIAETIAGAKAAGFLGAPTAIIPIAPVSGTPPWALPDARPDTATVHVLWPGLERGEELVPLPDGADFTEQDLAALKARFIAAQSEPVRVLSWDDGAEVQGVAVPPGWGESAMFGNAEWAETTFPGLYDLTGGYAYPHGLPRHDTAERFNLLFGTQPWTGGDETSTAELAAFRFVLETAPLDADAVFDLMGGTS